MGKEDKNRGERPAAAATPTTLLGKIDYVDRKLSGYLHTCVVKPRFLELIILPFAFLFQPHMVPFLLATVGIFLPYAEMQ